jgi:hypothetical protein
MTIASVCREQVISEINALPEEYLPFVLQLVRMLHESIALKSAADSVQLLYLILSKLSSTMWRVGDAQFKRWVLFWAIKTSIWMSSIEKTTDT